MEWTDETIARLKALWQEGLSTAEIGRQIGITKNAVVGKAHRLGLPPRPSPIRRQGGGKASAAKPAVTGSAEENRPVPPVAGEATAGASPATGAGVSETPAVLHSEPAVAVSASVDVAEREKPVAAVVSSVAEAAAPVSVTAAKTPGDEKPAPVAAPKPVTAETVSKPAPVAKASAASRAALRSISGALEPRRRGPSCCWPLGDPGTPEFHFCGATPLPGKPYCAEHAALAYVKLRDRRDNVA